MTSIIILLIIVVIIEGVALRRALIKSRTLEVFRDTIKKRIADAMEQAPTKVYPLPPSVPELVEAVRPLVQTAKTFDAGGSYKRDWVYRTYTKANPTVSDSAVHHAISFAWAEEKSK